MQVKCFSLRAHGSDQTITLLNQDIPARPSEKEDDGIGVFCRDSHGLYGREFEPEFDGVVVRSVTNEKVGLHGDYRVSVMLTKNDIANLVEIAWGNKTLNEFIAGMTRTNPSA